MNARSSHAFEFIVICRKFKISRFVCRKNSKLVTSLRILVPYRIRIELQSREREREIKHTEAIGHCMHTQYCALSRLARSLSLMKIKQI